MLQVSLGELSLRADGLSEGRAHAGAGQWQGVTMSCSCAKDRPEPPAPEVGGSGQGKSHRVAVPTQLPRGLPEGRVGTYPTLTEAAGRAQTPRARARPGILSRPLPCP